MASGFGTFNSTTRVSSAGAVVSATLWQEVDTTNRTVTVKLRVTAAYYRQATGSWTPGAGGLIYTSQNTNNYLGGYVGNSTNSSTGGTIGLSSVSGVTYNQGLIYNIQEGYVVARSGCYAEAPIISKTYSYNTSGDAITDTWSAELYIPTTGSTRSQLSGSFTTDSIGSTSTPPSGLAVEWKSHTWNSVTGKVTLSSYGAPSSETNRYIELGVCSSSNTAYGAPYRYVTALRSTNSTMTVQANSSGAFALKGATPYKLGAWASNTQLHASTLQSTVRYTPPAPLQSITKTETPGNNYISTTFTITGGNSTNNSNNNVQTQFRWSDGNVWTSWTNVGSAGTAWTAVTTVAQNVPYASNITVQARQVYQNQYSEVKELTYTSAAATAPSGLTIAVNSKTWNSANLTGAVGDYGKPKSLNGRKLNIGLATNNTSGSDALEVQGTNISSNTVTVNQNSTVGGGSGFTFKGMMTVYPYTYANNTKASNITFGNAEVLPPAPGQLSYSVDPTDIHLHTITYTGDASKNITTYTQADLTRTVRYADSSDPTNWTYIANDVSAPVGGVTTQQVSLTAGHTYTVEAWMDYMGEQSEVSTVTFTVAPPDGKLYCSMGGQTEQIEHFYGSVNGQTKKIKKLYASVNGVAKLIFED